MMRLAAEGFAAAWLGAAGLETARLEVAWLAGVGGTLAAFAAAFGLGARSSGDFCGCRLGLVGMPGALDWFFAGRGEGGEGAGTAGGVAALAPVHLG